MWLFAYVIFIGNRMAAFRAISVTVFCPLQKLTQRLAFSLGCDNLFKTAIYAVNSCCLVSYHYNILVNNNSLLSGARYASHSKAIGLGRSKHVVARAGRKPIEKEFVVVLY